MLVLGIDTATLVCSAGLVHHGRLIGEHTLNIEKTHSQRLMPLVSRLLEAGGFHPKDLKGIAVAMGPGSFTGIRIGMATAKGLAQGLDVPLVGIPTLDIIAAQFIYTHCLVCPILDARRHQVYTAFYRSGESRARRVSQYMAISLEDLVRSLEQFPEKGILFPGDALDTYRSFLQENLGERFVELPQPFRLNRGGIAAWLGYERFRDGVENQLYSLVPLYVRKPQAQIRWEREKGV